MGSVTYFADVHTVSDSYMAVSYRDYVIVLRYFTIVIQCLPSVKIPKFIVSAHGTY